MNVMVERAEGIDVRKSMISVKARFPCLNGERISEVVEAVTCSANLISFRIGYVAYGAVRTRNEDDGICWKSAFDSLVDAIGTRP